MAHLAIPTAELTATTYETESGGQIIQELGDTNSTIFFDGDHLILVDHATGLDGKFAPWVGEIIKDIKTKIILICDRGREKEAITRLSRIGFDNCLGFLDGGMKKWIKKGLKVIGFQRQK